MSNKENVVQIKSKMPKLVARANSKERLPLKSLPAAHQNQQDQAGPIGIKKPALVEKIEQKYVKQISKMSNKENVVQIKSKMPKLVARANSKERLPLKSLPAAHQNQQDQAGPIGIKKPALVEKIEQKYVKQISKMSNKENVVQIKSKMPKLVARANSKDRLPLKSLPAAHQNQQDQAGPIGIKKPALVEKTEQKYVKQISKMSNKENVVRIKSKIPKLVARADSKEQLPLKSFPAAHQTQQDQAGPSGIKKPACVKKSWSPTMKAVKKENQALETATSAVYVSLQIYNRDYISDNLNHLLEIEMRQQLRNTLARNSRRRVVNWIVNVNGSLGSPAVVQLACWYLDSYLKKMAVPLKRLQLVAASCYWIATKVHGGMGVTSARLECWSGFAFTKHDVVAMEKQVYCALNFPRTPCVVHDFVPYLCAWCCDEGGAARGAAFMALCVALVYVFGSGFPPSVVAAACVRCTLMLTGDCRGIARLEACPIYKKVVRKSRDFREVTALVRNAVRTVTSNVFEYKAPFEKYAGPPYYVALRITEAINKPKVLKGEQRR